MRKGGVPRGWEVHHKLPIDDSGTNSLDNLVLIQKHQYHKVISNYQRTFARNMKPGEKITIDFPIPDGYIYPKKH